MASTLKRSGVTSYVGMLVVVCEPTGWNTPTLLCRFVEKTGANSVFIITGEAIEQFRALEMFRIYSMTISPKCLKKSEGEKKWGVRSLYDVTVKYQLKLEVSAEAWPLQMSYNFKQWQELNQCEEGSFIDLVGVVVEDPICDPHAKLPKTKVVVGTGVLTQEVELLGIHSHISLKKDDKVAFGGLRVASYRGRRCIQTGYLTIIEPNPAPREGIPDVALASDDQPRRKAMRFTERAALPVAEAKRLLARLISDSQYYGSAQRQDFALLGTLSQLDKSFFTEDPPLVGDEHKEYICWKTTMTDASGQMPVRVWDEACRSVFGITADRLREMWGQGADDEEQRGAILTTLNAKLDAEVFCLCTADVRVWGSKTAQHDAQTNVNALEFRV